MKGCKIKKIVIAVLLTMSTSVIADGHHHGIGWVAPLIGGIAAGAIIGGGIYNNQRPYYAPPPVYYPPNYGGSPYGHHYESIYDAYCGCYKTVLVPNY